MNRLCSKFRQRLTLVHMDQFTVIALEGMQQNMTHSDQLREVVNHWYMHVATSTHTVTGPHKTTRLIPTCSIMHIMFINMSLQLFLDTALS